MGAEDEDGGGGGRFREELGTGFLGGGAVTDEPLVEVSPFGSGSKILRMLATVLRPPASERSVIAFHNVKRSYLLCAVVR
jgi:hypothetical protein